MADITTSGPFSCPVIVILGSTGTGKSKLGIELGVTLGGEIISADSMQVYKGLDIITNKVTKEETQLCKHHMIDLVSPLDHFNVVEFRNRALPLMLNLGKESKIPIVVGGTNYYIEALLWDILVDKSNAEEDVSPTQSDQQRKVNDEQRLLTSTVTPEGGASCVTHNKERVERSVSPIPVSLQGENSLYEELKLVDPAMAMRLHPNDSRKISRSLEIYREHGRRHSDILVEQKAQSAADFLGGPMRFSNVLVFWLTCDCEILNDRLSDRVDEMVNKGLVKEIEDFNKLYTAKCTSEAQRNKMYIDGIFQSIGFKEFHPYLTCNEKDPRKRKIVFDDCVVKLKQATCRYAKKQIAWVKNRFLARPKDSAPDIYELTVNDPQRWTQDVFEPALEIAKAFLSGSQIKREPIPRLPKQDPEKVHHLHSCDVCHGRLIMGEDAWNSHCRSRTHRKLRAKRIKLEAAESTAP